MRYLLPLALLLFSLSGCQDDDDVPGPVANQIVPIIITEQAKFPEGIAYDATTNRVYTGSTVDGTIYAGLKTDSRLQPLPTTGASIGVAVGMDISGTDLYVAGGPTGSAYVVNLGNNQVRELPSDEVPAGDSTFINDVTVGADGTAYLTDSYFPVLYRYTGGDSLESWLDLDSTIINYQASFNLNGIVIAPGDRYLLTVQSNTGILFRIDVTDRSVTEVNVGGFSLTAGDGLALDNDLLFVVRNQNAEVVTIAMDGDYANGQVVGITNSPDFRFPTTVAATPDSLLLVNGQLDQRGPGGSPVLPFTISKFAR
ncbi:hypothetical protein LEM8419_00642 [Neolewinella maritima]|uniref:Superoxide dismutase n=1 Tax=Neolewinella maritima TaxID=1383882 RepID=A0ABN8F5K8_9BACT|nr:SMP-30/gluconolactonase/LRE family protein [Neolewinella maritima]CAH0999344.1 hypothetical protein LEM8419_00642 [Neolewinella maritima]